MVKMANNSIAWQQNAGSAFPFILIRYVPLRFVLLRPNTQKMLKSSVRKDRELRVHNSIDNLYQSHSVEQAEGKIGYNARVWKTPTR